MPAVAYTTEAAFAADLLLMLGRGVVADLAVTSSDLQIVVNGALLSYGAETIADATDLARLWTFGKWRLWEWAEAEYSAQFRFVTDSQTVERQQKWDHAAKMRDAAKVDVDRMLQLELIAAEADAGGFEIAEEILTPFNARERFRDEYQRGSF